VQQQEGAPGHWHCEAVVSRSVAEGITNYAIQEGVDLIAMYTHDRKGLARLIRGSIAAQVQRNSPIEVRVFRPRELAATTS
jgi:nucleotide-binding universal stress UspA family protein